MTYQDVEIQQLGICHRYGAIPFATSNQLTVGISQNLFEGVLPLNGLRHPPQGNTSGWYLWAGEEMSLAEDFFLPIHIHHLYELVPAIMKYLLLPPAWRFLIVPPDYEDVWQDDALLNIDN